jgi:hypothetical protein
MRIVPPLPRPLVDPTPVLLVGTGGWFLGLLLFGISDLSSGRISPQFWTCLVGCVLGLIGYAIFRWQRAASRRGARGAWRGLAGLSDE